MATEAAASHPPALLQEVKDETHGNVKAGEQEVDTKPKEPIEEVNKPSSGESHELNGKFPLPVTQETCEETKTEPTNIEVEEEMPTTEVTVLDKETKSDAVDVQEKKTEPITIQLAAVDVEEKKSEPSTIQEEETILHQVEVEENKTEPITIQEEETIPSETESHAVDVDKIEIEQQLKTKDSPSAAAALESEDCSKEVGKINVQKEPEAVLPSAEFAETIIVQKVEVPVVEQVKEASLEEEPKAEEKEIVIPPPEQMKACETKDVEQVVTKEVVPETGDKEEKSLVTEDPIPLKKQEEQEVVRDSVAEGVAEISEHKEEEQLVAESSVPVAVAATEVAEKNEDEQVIVKEAVLEGIADIVEKKDEEPIVAKELIPEGVSDQIVEYKESTEDEQRVVEELVPEKVTKTGENKEDGIVGQDLVPDAVAELVENKVEELVKETETTVVEDTSTVTEQIDKEAESTIEEHTKIDETKVDVKRDEEAMDGANVLNKIQDKKVKDVTSSLATTPEAVENREQKIEEPVAAAESNGDGAVKETIDQTVGDIVKKSVTDPDVETRREDENVSKEEKQADEGKTKECIPKEEVVTKSTQKQSNSIIGKVKKSFIKAKKAIIGKNPNTKIPPEETKDKDEVKV